MRHGKSMAGVAGLALLLATTAVAQDTGNPAKTPAKSGGAAQQPKSATPVAKDVTAPAFVPVKLGPQAPLLRPDGQPLGNIHDHVVDRETGKIPFSIVESSRPEDKGRRSLVPFERFTWNATKQALELPLTADELAKLPEWDPKALQSLSGLVGKAPAPKEGVPQDASAQKERVKNLLASEIAKSPVTAGGEAFGTIETALLEPQRGGIPLVLVAQAPLAQPEVFVIPWKASKHDDPKTFALSQSLADMEQAPKIPKGDLQPLADEAFIQSVLRFYKLSPPLGGS